MNIARQISEGRATIGIEFGSTRIKAILIGEDFIPAASGAYDWENRLENGIWTYSADDILKGMQCCFNSLMDDVKEKFGVELKSAASIGVSAMMHGYLVFDKDNNLLVPFRTWRNTMTGEAADALTEEFDFNIPQRWSIAHLYQAIMNKEPHVPQISFMTTLAGYIHWLLTGEKVLGIGDASGVFPIDTKNGRYDAAMLEKFSKITESCGFSWKLTEILPGIVPVGECAGVLTEEGAKLLDPTGTFGAGVKFCPPEGDAGTGMTATNSILPKTGNVSAGTSIFAMIVLEKALSTVHREIDIVTTPCGDPVAMVHCNNCTTDIDTWANMFSGALKEFGVEISKPQLYDKLYEKALAGELDCGGVLSYNYYSGEHVVGLTKGMPLLMHKPDADFSFANIIRSLIYSSMATLKLGMDILLEDESVKLERINAHGGLFKSPITGQHFLAAALNVPVALQRSAGEGGAWGIALLAAYVIRNKKELTLADFLEKRVFYGQGCSCVQPDEMILKGFSEYIARYKAGLDTERSAVTIDMN